MNIAEAQQFLSRERARWFLGGTRLSDDEMLRRRERLHDKLAGLFALATLAGYFILPTLLNRFGDWIASFGTPGTLICFILAACQQSVKAGQCQEVRRFLEIQLGTQSDSQT